MVAENDRIRVEKISEKSRNSGQVTFEDVLLVVKADGTATAGTPTVSGARVTAEIVSDGKGKKIDVMKYKPKVRYRKKIGHRQLFTEVKITKIAS